ncbi:MAG: bifunctional pyr operon transcriptional regulator/uracil phosphoribosyltransferase PyrR [Nitrospirae bacterium]|nr:bifunctional pyr operon transcriptional regulator/uracil phosphoribosyltransferase PyrR [Nitrospirota bacterium]
MSIEILNSKEIENAITRITHEIIEKNGGTKALCLIGIQRGGVLLAERISRAGSIDEIGSLDISLYRDDINIKNEQPVVRATDIKFSLNGKTVVLVDDVLFTGRSIRAAMDALIDFGRPAKIQLAVLIDRGHRELPIRADYVGKNIPTTFNDTVEVRLHGHGSKDNDSVILIRGNSK